MRTMLKVCCDTEATNRQIKDNKMAAIIQATTERIRPEAAYFTVENGHRTAIFFFDLKETHLLPSFLEPLWMELQATIEVIPVMNQEELKKGLELWAKQK